MTCNQRLSFADHQAAAWKCQVSPGVEILVNVYVSRQSGDSIARGIRNGKFPAYRPAGLFDAHAHMHIGGTAVWARYVGEGDAEPLPQTLTVRVPNYGSQPGYEGVRVVEVEISARCQTCGGPRGPLTPEPFLRDGVRHIRDAWENECGHQDDYLMVLAEADRRKRRIPEPVAIAPRGGELRGVTGGEYCEAVDVLAEALATQPWLSALAASRLLSERGHEKGAEQVRTFMTTNSTKNCTSAKSAALYLIYCDTQTRAADTDTSTGETK